MKSGNKDKTKKEFEEIMLEVRRVTRVTTGGRKLSFRATVLAGNKKGKIGIGVSKAADVTAAVQKASREAYKNMFTVPITGHQTVPYPVTIKYKSCIVKLLPAAGGTGLKAGSSVRAVLELAGYENVLSKIMGSSNKLNNALATIKALSSYKHAEYFNQRLVKKSVSSFTDHDESDQDLESSSIITNVQEHEVGIIPEVVIEKVSTDEKKDSSKRSNKK